MNFDDLVNVYGENLFEVGGMVRDVFTEHKIKDFDYCLTVSKENFENTFPNITSVGNNFPVYIFKNHKNENVEISLTRTEKSNGEGYNDFIVNETGVTIEEDLARRDFTINSFCKNYITGEYIDPFDGIGDIKRKLIRTINPNCFSDDPLRLIRAARFAARFDFEIEMTTYLMMVDNADRIIHIPKNRIVTELEKVYHDGGNYKKFFDVLSDTGVLKFIFSDIENLKLVPAGPEKYHGTKTAYEHSMDVVMKSKGKGFHVFLATLFHDIGKYKSISKGCLPSHYGHEFDSYLMCKEFFDDHCFDSFSRDFTIFCAKNHMKAHLLDKMRPSKVIEFYKEIPKRYYESFFEMVNCDHEFSESQNDVKKRLDILRKTFKVDVKKVAMSKNKEVEVKNQMLKFYNSL